MTGNKIVNYSPPPVSTLLVNDAVADNSPEGLATWGYTVVTLTNNLPAGNEQDLQSRPASATSLLTRTRFGTRMTIDSS